MKRDCRFLKKIVLSLLFMIIAIPSAFASWDSFILKAGGFSVHLSWHFSDPVAEQMTASGLWPLLSLFSENDAVWSALEGRRDFQLSYSVENGQYSLIDLSGEGEVRRNYETFPEMITDLSGILRSDYGFRKAQAEGFRLYRMEIPFSQGDGFLDQAPETFNVYLGPSGSGMQGTDGYVLLFTSSEEVLEYLQKNRDLDFTCMSSYATRKNIDHIIR